MSAGLRPSGVLRVAACIGLLAGFAEVAMMAGVKYATGQFTFVSLDAAWMAPLGDLVLAVAVPGLLLALVTRLLPARTHWPLAAGVPAGLGAWLVAIIIPTLAGWAAWLIAAGVGLQVGRSAATSAERWDRRTRQGLPLLAALVVLVAGSMMSWRAWREHRADRARTAATAGAPNVLLLVLDTVRSMDLSLYGYDRETTPRLTAWAARGVTFEQALAPAPWTLASHASMFTGRWPQEVSADYFVPLDATYPVLAEVLAARGYRTGGFVGNSKYCGWETGLQRGFAHYEDYDISLGQVAWSTALGRLLSRNRNLRHRIGTTELLGRKPAAGINNSFLRWVGRDQGSPFFAFLNYFDAHQPYLPPAPFDTLWGPVHSDGYPRRIVRPTADHPEWQEEDAVPARNDYDRAIAGLDHAIGALLAELERRGLLGNTLVVLVGDHGEEFAEHGVTEHGGSLYRPAVQVPLVVSWPGHVPAGARVTAPVTTRDLSATVMDLLGATDAPFPGRTLARWWQSPNAPATDTLYSELSYAPKNADWIPVSKGTMRSVVLNGYRYIRGGDGREELYDFAHDSWERRDLAGMAGEADALSASRLALDQLLTLHRPVR
jgi:arylsulfatase A-like enzyme